MNRIVESTTRGPLDYFHFGVVFLGIIVGIAGVVTSSVAAGVCGLALILFGLGYFLVNCSQD